jgi:prepilin-type N-terminal cleavage/methylation domain-containing protein/prepilin-type processing-associated H-X9-DG protein
MKKTPRKVRRIVGFTLTELLTVMAILAVLVVMVVPGVSRMTEGGRSAQCLSNLRQLGAASQLYSSENDAALVPMCTGSTVGDAKTWRAHLVPYLNAPDTQTKIFCCPSDKIERGRTYSNTEKINGVRPASYGINFNSRSDSYHRLHQYTLGGFQAVLKTSTVAKPAQTIFISDLGSVQNPTDPVGKWLDKTPRGANFGYARFPSDGGFSGGDAWNIFPRHGSGRANVVFYDGHAATVNIEKEIMAHAPGNPLCIYDNY